MPAMTEPPRTKRRKPPVSPVDLARRLGVSHVTANRTIARLQKPGHVTAQPYRAIFLTDQGRVLAAEWLRAKIRAWLQPCHR